MIEVDRLRVVYELQDQQYLAGMERMRNQTRATNDQIIKQAQRAERGVSAAFSSIAKLGAGLFAGGATAAAAREYLKFADAATKMQNSLKVVGLEGQALNDVYSKLYASAQKNSAPVSSLVDLYSKLALTQKELGVSSEQLINFTDGISVALRVGGTDATAASGALLQLSQALGGGIVRAEEFNSILEGAPTIAQAMARGLKEAGGSVAELRKIVIDGKLSSRAAFDAFNAGSEELRRQAESSQITVGQSFTQLGNSLLTVVGKFDQATGASGRFADGVSDLSAGLDSFDVEGMIAKIQSVIDKFNEAESAGTAWLNNLGNADFFKRINEANGIPADATTVDLDLILETRAAEEKAAALEKEIAALQAQIENNTSLGFDNSGAIARIGEVRAQLAALRADMANMSTGTFYTGAGYQPPPKAPNMDTGTFYTGEGYQAPRPATPVKTVSLADYTVPASGGSGGKKGKKGGGGSGKDQKTAADILVLGADDIRDLERQIQLVGKSTEETARLQARWEMLDAAKKEGVKVDDALNAKIDAQAEKFGQLTAQLERAELAQEQFDQAVDGVADAFAGALLAGESLRDGLAQVFKQIASDILSSGIRSALTGQFGGGGGFLGSIFGGLFGGGDPLTAALRGAGLPARANGGPVTAGQMYLTGERGPEPFVPAVNGRILSVAQAQAALRSGQGAGASVSFNPTINVGGNVTQDDIARIHQVMEVERKNFIQNVRRAQAEIGQRYN
ncbi:tape measure protein [Paracoccus yeei]|uniref:tape measure protein n=1 Tax=Paracoccus yeei TaxID=147645 RepID=UPI003BF78B38